MISALLLALPGAGAGAGAAFALPEAFIGLWEGAVDYNILGPSFTFKFSVSRSPSGDYLMEDNINFDGMGMGWQRFYVEGSGSTAGAMWYCGSFNNFADNVEQTGSGRLNLFYPEDQSASSVSFCLDSEDPEVMGRYNPFKMGCQGCDCANFTIAHDAETDSLLTQMTMSGSSVGSKHLWATLGRIGPAPEVTDADMPAHGDDFSCDFSEGGRDSVPVVQDGNATSASTSAEAPPHPVSSSSSSSSSSGCPYMRQQKAKNAAAVQRRAEPVPIMMGDTPPRAPKAASAVKATNSTAAAVAGGYQQCYSLSTEVGYRLQWTLDSDAQLLHCAVSVPLTDADGDSESDKYVAIGFRPLSRSTDTSLLRQNTGHHMNFAMAGADIVTGSVAAGVKTYYAQDYTGAPVADNSLELTDASVAVEEGDGEGSPSRVVLKFTRPLVGGYLLKHYDNPASINTAYADIIWATGKDIVKAEGGAEAVTCKYHSNGRGLRVVNWEDPSTAFSDDWRC